MRVLTTRVVMDKGDFVQGSIMVEDDVIGTEAYETTNQELFQNALISMSRISFGDDNEDDANLAGYFNGKPVMMDGVDIPGHNVPYEDEIIELEDEV